MNRSNSRVLRARPNMRERYASEIALLNTRAKRWSVSAVVLVTLMLPFMFANDVLLMLSLAMVAAVGAIGLNLITGYAGQVSLGHAFFIGLGAYTGAVLGGDPGGRVTGYGLPVWIWLPAAGVVAAVAGVIIAPLAVRLKGLYLAVVTLGVVFIGEHLFREMRQLTGGPGVGRSGPQLSLFGLDFNSGGAVLGLVLDREQRQFYLAFAFLCVLAIAARNIARSKIGRAFAAVRDRDVAAAVIGVNVTQYKLLAFALSSAYAGLCGALYFAIVGYFEPGTFGLMMSVQYIAMIFIGGLATISGSIMGAVFVVSLGRIAAELTAIVPFLVSDSTSGPGLTVFQFETVLYGSLIVIFLIFEPRGLYGIWIRIRNYWKGWPFTY